MAIGDQSDIQARLRQLLPNGWFPPGASQFVDAVVAGIANTLAAIFGLFAYLRLQTRIQTATDGFLDLIAGDFFGTSLFREAHQTDESFRARIIANIFRERGTRNAVISILKQLTGRTPIVFEVQRPSDTGAYGGPLGYGIAGSGGYGSMILPFQAFVTALRPLGQGIANVSGYGIPAAGYGVGQGEYISLGMIGGVNDLDLFAAVDSVRPAGYTIWMKVTS